MHSYLIPAVVIVNGHTPSHCFEIRSSCRSCEVSFLRMAARATCTRAKKQKPAGIIQISMTSNISIYDDDIIDVRSSRAI